MKLLMHTCCAPCSIYCIETLRSEGIEPTLYWFNPNIHPYMEYKSRRDCLKEYAKNININAIFEENYGLDEFCKEAVKDLKSRCTNYCYPVRIKKTFEYAKENGYDAVTTTLLYSIYQNHDFIKELMEKYSKEYNIEFLYRDFRIGFWEGHQKAHDLGLYMQKYCGCIFSEESRYYCHNQAKPDIPTDTTAIREQMPQVKRIENKEDYMDLLLEADPSKASIMKYLQDSDVYGLKLNDEIISLAVILPISNKTLELKNLVTKKEYRNKGYAKRLLKHLCGNYKQKYDKMLVGTTENNIPFYVKQGFDKYEKTIKNYFIYNYGEEIWDGDLNCTDMYYYSKDLKKKMKYN